MWPFRFVAVPVCDRFGFWPFRSVAVSVCGRFGLWPFRLVAVSVCGRSGLWPFRFVAVSVVAVSVCGRYDLLPRDPVYICGVYSRVVNVRKQLTLCSEIHFQFCKKSPRKLPRK